MKLKDWLEEKGVTGVELAERLKMSQGAVSKIVRGLVWPEAETMTAIVAETKGDVTASDILATYQETQAALQAAE